MSDHDEGRGRVTSPPDPTPSGRVHRQRNAAVGWSVLLIVVATLPLIASALRFGNDWVPQGDEAAIALRGDDLFRAETPLLGMPSTVGAAVDEQVHHPGPLESQAIGLVAVLSDDPRVPVATVALVNLVSIVVALVWARRIGGLPLLVVASATTALLLWSLRGPILATPFNPYAALLPFLAFLVSLVAVWDHRRWAATSAVLFGSWAAQAHLTTSGPVIAACALMATVAGWRRVTGRHTAPVERSRLLVGTGVLVGVWAFPLADVLANDGGNVRAVIRASGALERSTLGLGQALDVVVNAVAVRPVWAQAGMGPRELLRAPTGTATLWAVALAVGAIAVAVGCRRSRPAATAGVMLSGASLLAGGYLTSKIPRTLFNTNALHNYVWLWPTVAVLWVATVAGLVHLVGARISWRPARARATPAAAVAVGVVVAVALAGVATPHRSSGEKESVYARSITADAIEALDPAGAYLIDLDGDIATYGQGTGLLFALERAGYDVRVPARFEPTFGPHRIAPDGDERDVLTVRITREVEPAGEGARTVATFLPDDELVRRRDRAEAEVAEEIRRIGGTALPLGPRIGPEDAQAWVQSGGYINALTFGVADPRLRDLPASDELLALLEEPAGVVSVTLASDD